MRYTKGRNFEYSIKKKLEDQGYYVCRSAGSHGAFDLIAIKNGVPWGIQCKASERVSKTELEKLREIGRKYGIIPCIAKKNGRRHVVICLYNMREIL
jgi:Holliday junction resolvase